ncbi:hypothetical protein M426DRAFT_320466 [Hypoxylon sp. CI-4A]|nr:hypothetical protein M426DRAFT_320466 [Hypoxylon sp. CI-4A]
MATARQAALRRLVTFYDPFVPNPAGMDPTFNQVISWPDNLLESKHDFIQWLFPTHVPSAYVANAPVLDEATIRHFRSHQGILLNMKLALVRMMRFYGFDVRYTVAGCLVMERPGGREKFLHWIRRGDHNQKRITRIIASLRLMGLGNEAQNIYEAFVDANRRYNGDVTETALAFWQTTLLGSLNIMGM